MEFDNKWLNLVVVKLKSCDHDVVHIVKILCLV